MNDDMTTTRCSKCGEYVEQGENQNVLLNPHILEAHRCDPGNLRVPSGMWRGYRYRDMARMVASRNGWIKGRIKPSDDTL